MKKRLAMLFAIIMILTCVPVMADTVPAGRAATGTVSVSAATGTWKKTGSNYRYYVSGKYVKSTIRSIGGSYYGFNSNGYLVKGWFTLGGKKYYASSVWGAKGYGKILTGYRKIGNYYYYLNPSDKGAMVKGVRNVGGKLYYFNTSTGRQLLTKGATFVYGGYNYTVQAGGIVKKGAKAGAVAAGGTDAYGMDKKAQGYSSSTRYMILVNKKKHVVNIYQGKKGAWVCIRRNIKCTTGKSSTPSPSGKFTLNHRTAHKYGWKDFTASTAFYAYRISAGNYFHSILYRKGSRNPATAKIKDGTLGKSRSNSCIRLPLKDAKFIYTTLGKKTRVVVY